MAPELINIDNPFEIPGYTFDMPEAEAAIMLMRHIRWENIHAEI